MMRPGRSCPTPLMKLYNIDTLGQIHENLSEPESRELPAHEVGRVRRRGYSQSGSATSPDAALRRAVTVQ